MPLAKFVPFRAADMNQAWLRNERFWPCPPVPDKRLLGFTPVMEELARDVRLPIWLMENLRAMCTCTELLLEGDILAPCPVHGWVGEECPCMRPPSDLHPIEPCPTHGRSIR